MADEDEEKTYKFAELSPDAKKDAIERWREKNYEWDDYDTKSLTETFEEQLESLGLPHDHVYWSLGHTQGDGVTFDGKIDIQEYLKKNNLLREYASLFAPAYESSEGESSVGQKQRTQAEAIASSLEGFGLVAEVRQSKGCYFVDAFENGDKMEWIATFCVAAKRGRRDNVSVESESEHGTGAWLLKRVGESFKGGTGQGDYRIPIEESSFSITASRNYYSMTVEYDLNVSEDWLSPEQKRDFEALYEHIKDHVGRVARDLQRQGYDEIEYKSSDEVIAETLEANDYDFDEDGNWVS